MKILCLGEPVLREKGLPVPEVTDEIRQLVKDMFVAMDKARGTGLAAPQIGKSLRLFVLRADDGIDRTFINPHIIATSPETSSYEEGCLSIPGLYQFIVRPKRVTIQALNEDGKPFTLEADDFLARVIQHEYDHLDGILYIDRADPAFKSEAEAVFARRAARKLERNEAKAVRKKQAE